MVKSGEELPPLRRLQWIDAVEEQIAKAVETNRPIAWSGSDSSGLGYSITLVNMTLLSYIARNCARAGAKLIAIPGYERNIPQVRQYTLDAYAAEGVLDQVDEDYTIRFIQGKWCGSKDVRTAHMVWEENIAALIMLGTSGCQPQQLQQGAAAIGATVCTGDSKPLGIMYSVVYGDYTLFGEENYAFMAYMTGESVQYGGVFAMDYFKYIMISLSIVGWVLLNLGSSWIIDLLGM
jgi:hypothetical protein